MKNNPSFHQNYEQSVKRWGNLPAVYSGLGTYSDSLRPANLLSFRVFDEREGPVYMLTTPCYDAPHNFSIMRRDLESLLDLGLERMQSHNPNEVSLYFSERSRKLSAARHSR
jgi:hypothetical protein